VRVRRAEILLLLLVGCAAGAQAFANVTASLDSSQVAVGETVQLTLERDGGSGGQPDVAALQQDFDILGTSSSTNISLVNGSLSEKTQVVLTLAPKVTGHLTIPPLSWNGERTQPLALDVSGPGGSGQSGAAGAQAAPAVFLETSASPQQPYVEGAVHLTIRLFMAEPLYRADLELPASSDVVVKRLGSDEDSQAQRNGRTYQVITRQFVLFPLHSGKLTLPGPVLEAEVAVTQPQSAAGRDPFNGIFGGSPFGGMLRTVRPIRLNGNPLVLQVRPRPAGAVGNYWLPADNVTLSAAWNPTKLSAQTGDPLILDLDLRAVGLTAAQLPDLSSLLTLPAGLKAYPDQPKLDDSTQDGKLVGSRDQTIALMADSPGRYTIPALAVNWWDTNANQLRTATVPARTLTILPAPANSAASAPASATPALPAPSAQTQPQPPQQSPPPAAPQHAPPPPATNPAPARSPSEWQWISIGLAVVWLATLGAWLWSRRRSRSAPRPVRPAVPTGPHQFRPDPAKERAAFRAACQANDPQAARAHLLAWATALWGTTPAGVNAVGARIGDANIAGLLRDLDRACYAGGAWQGDALAAALTELPASPGKSGRQRDGLAPLYP
jgi:BatD DUF11 like domain